MRLWAVLRATVHGYIEDEAMTEAKERIDAASKERVSALVAVATQLFELDKARAWEVMHEVNLQAQRTIWRPPLAIQALQNLVDAAEARGQEGRLRDGAVCAHGR